MNAPRNTRENLKRLNDRELLKSVRVAVQKEREATAVVLRHFLLVEERRLFALKHSSLFAWATVELGYSEGAAQRRIDAARLLRELPSLAEKIESGALSLTNLSQAKSFFRQEKKAGKPLLPAEKAAVLTSLERKSSREALKHLVSLSSNPHVLAVKGTLRSIGNGQSEMRLIMSDALVDDLIRIKGLWAHAHPDADWPEIIARMAKIVLKNIDPLERAQRAKLAKEKRAQEIGSCLKTSQRRNSGAGGGSVGAGRSLTTRLNTRTDVNVSTDINLRASANTGASEGLIHADVTAGREGSLEQSENLRAEIDRETGEVQFCLPLPPAVKSAGSRVITAAVNHEIWPRDQGQCAYVDENGKRCPSRYALERDHKIAFARGGGNDAGNIRLYCHHHNALHADQTFGRKKMARMREKRMFSSSRQAK